MPRIDAVPGTAGLKLRLSGIAALTLLAACGGSGDSGGGSPAPAPAPAATPTPTPTPAPAASVAFAMQMSPGWNLGNSLEAIGAGAGQKTTSQETYWGNPPVTQELMNAVKAAGFKSVRIPASWAQYADASDNIAPFWLDRVAQVVDYARNAGLYVVINIHWDGGWMQPTYADQAVANARLTKFWTQIATRLRDHDDHVLFAGTNEVHPGDFWGAPTPENCEVQNGFNKTFVDAVRATGGKNATRYLVVQGYVTNVDYTLSCNPALPADTAANRLMMEIHYYDPYNFALNDQSAIWQWGSIATDPAATEPWANEAFVDAQFQKLKVAYVDKGIPVILGEYGAILRTEHDPAGRFRTYWDEYVTGSAHKHGIVPMYWDNGYPSNHQFGLFDRATATPAHAATISAIVNAAK